MVPQFLDELTPYLRNGQFLLGQRISLADFWVGTLYVNFFKKKNIYEQQRWATLLAQYPLFQQYGERFVAENRGYLNKRTVYDK